MSIGLLWLQCGGSSLIQRLHRLGRKLRQLPAVRDQSVGGQHARPTRIGHDGEPWALRPRLLGQDFRHVEQVGDSLYPQHAAAPERRIQHFVAAGKDPVCEAAACAAASVRPALITMIGLFSETSRAADRNDRASPTDSMYITMLLVRGSFPR